MSESQPPPRQRGNPSMADILRSVAVLVLIVLAIWLVGLLQTETPEANAPPPWVTYHS